MIAPNDPAAMRHYCEECVSLNIPYLFDPSQQVARNPHPDLKYGVEHAHALFCNEYEFDLLQKHTGFSISDIKSMVNLVVVTLGEKGAQVFSKGKTYEIPVVPTEQIADPTGVGDAFRGGFLRGYRLGMNLQTCGQIGSLAATYCLEKNGTQNHFYTPKDFIKRYRQYFDDHGELEKIN